jgi:Leucine-rich repeat (LRR) protein
MRSRVSDLAPLAKVPQLRELWLTACPVTDIGPLKDVPLLVSLTVAETSVSDLSPLTNHPLERLHIAKTRVTDLSVLRTLRLTRLVFTPERIRTGIELAREMPTLRELDTEFPVPGRRPLPPRIFWELYDAGQLK